MLDAAPAADPTDSAARPVARIDSLRVEFRTRRGTIVGVKDVSFDVKPGETVCDDGIDDDGNGYTDCEDFACADDEACAEDCTDGIDNDGDGYTDCDDFYCDEDPACIDA